MKNDIFDLAMKSVDELTLRINSIDRNINSGPTWCKIVPDSKCSPMVKSISDYKHLIYFPNNSTEYHHKAENFSKVATIESGTILEKVSGKTYVKGDTFTIEAGTDICPVSVGGEAFATVIVVLK